MTTTTWQEHETGSAYRPPAPVGLALRAGLEPTAVRLAALWGERDVNVLTNLVFFHRHRERNGRPLARDEAAYPALSREWIAIRDTIVRPALEKPRLATPGQAPTGMPPGPFGTLTASAPGRPSVRYPFTAQDVLWTARFIVGEAGGRDDPGNHAVIWAMFNRYALFTRTKYPSFEAFLRCYSTPLQSVLNSRRAAERHMHNADFMRTDGTYPGTSVPKGQLGRFLRLQRTCWQDLPSAARALALRALSGGLANPGIGNASEFDDTAVYFKDNHKRVPSEAEWRDFTINFPRIIKRNLIWIGDVAGLVQYRNNTFYLEGSARDLPAGAVRVVPP